MRARALAAALGALALAACAGARPAELVEYAAAIPGTAPAAVQGTSLLGDSLPYRAPQEDEARLHRAELDGALDALRADPRDEAAWVWAGRRLAYLGRYRGARSVFDLGLTALPDSAALYRHRGHRRITLRDLRGAEADLERAAAQLEGVPDRPEPDGLPNAVGVPRGTLGTAVHYHLALARYLQADFGGAREAWERCLALSTTDDMRVAALYWLVLTEARLGLDASVAARLAGVRPEMDVVENTQYHRLLLYFAGALERADVVPEDDAGWVAAPTVAYGLAAWDLAHGDEAAGLAGCARVVSGDAWPAFGHIAAEAELARAAGR